MYQQFFALFEENRFFEKHMENYLISLPFLKKAKTWRYIKISTRQHTRKVTTSYLLSTFELLTIFEKSKYRNISKLNPETDFVRGYTKNCTISYFEMFHIFWYIKHRGVYIYIYIYQKIRIILCSPWRDKLQFRSSFNVWTNSNRIEGNVYRREKYDSDYAGDIYHSAILLRVASSDK